MPPDTSFKQIKILLGDGPSMWRDGLRALLAAERDLDVAGEPGEDGPLVPRALKHRPDVVLCDFANGVAALPDLRRLRDRGLQIRVVVFGSIAQASALPREVLREIAAVISKDAPTELLLNSIRGVNRGSGAARIAPADRPAATGEQPVPLSRRERELVGLIALGFRNREIADKLFISEQTVKNHLHNIFEKTRIKDRLELALYAVFHGIHH